MLGPFGKIQSEAVKNPSPPVGTGAHSGLSADTVPCRKGAKPGHPTDPGHISLSEDLYRGLRSGEIEVVPRWVNRLPNFNELKVRCKKPT
jgi:hypothetical protein